MKEHETAQRLACQDEGAVKAHNPIDGFTIAKEELQFTGADLYRPECILATRDGSLWCADSRGGVQHISVDGRQTLICDNKNGDMGQDMLTGADLPNGICFSEDGDILIANQGRQCLEVMDRQGNRETLLDSIEGKPIGVINFVLRDSRGRVWITISTRHERVTEVMRPDIADGYIAVLEGGSARVVADGFALTNEIRFDTSEQYLYVAETFGKRVSRLKVSENGKLSERRTYGPADLGPAGFPDGIAFDSHGNLWGTITCGERIFAITPEEELRIIYDDRDEEACRKIDRDFYQCKLTQETIFSGLSSVTPATASITFGGPHLDNVFIGTLFAKTIPYFKAPVSGAPPLWW